jgi:hypothetical protein
MNRGYEIYRDKCLELVGKKYNQLETYRDERYNPFRLSRVAHHQPKSSPAGHLADTESEQRESKYNGQNVRDNAENRIVRAK